MIKKLLITVFVVLSFCGIAYPQIELSAGINAGGGIISANSPNEGAFTSSGFIEFFISPEDYLSTRLSFIYATDLNSLVPGSRNQYYPSVKGFSIKGIYSSYYTYNFFLEQGLGLIALNDKIYTDRNNWDFGIALSLLAGIDLRQNVLKGFRIGLGLEYGLTFIKYTIRYTSVHFQLQFIF